MLEHAWLADAHLLPFSLTLFDLHPRLQLLDTLRTLPERLALQREQRPTGATFGKSEPRSRLTYEPAKLFGEIRHIEIKICHPREL